MLIQSFEMVQAKTDASLLSTDYRTDSLCLQAFSTGSRYCADRDQRSEQAVSGDGEFLTLWKHVPLAQIANH